MFIWFCLLLGVAFEMFLLFYACFVVWSCWLVFVASYLGWLLLNYFGLTDGLLFYVLWVFLRFKFAAWYCLVYLFYLCFVGVWFLLFGVMCFKFGLLIGAGIVFGLLWFVVTCFVCLGICWFGFLVVFGFYWCFELFVLAGLLLRFFGGSLDRVSSLGVLLVMICVLCYM